MIFAHLTLRSGHTRPRPSTYTRSLLETKQSTEVDLGQSLYTRASIALKGQAIARGQRPGRWCCDNRPL